MPEIKQSVVPLAFGPNANQMWKNTGFTLVPDTELEQTEPFLDNFDRERVSQETHCVLHDDFINPCPKFGIYQS